MMPIRQSAKAKQRHKDAGQEDKKKRLKRVD
jgi:hypothetical protein